MTPEEKVIAWRDGTRVVNLKACSKRKLLQYRKIAEKIGFSSGVSQIDAILLKVLTRAEVEDIIEHLENGIGDFGGDMFRKVLPDKTLYGWSGDINGVLVEEDADLEVTDTEITDLLNGVTYKFEDLIESELKRMLLDGVFNC